MSLENKIVELENRITGVKLPKLPTNVLEWVEVARPTVGRTARNWDLTPFWLDIYEDNSPSIMVVAGRQTFKTTFCTDLIGCLSTSTARSEICYVTDNEPHLSAFSKQRLRIETFLQNPIPRQFLRHDRANIGEFSLVNDSAIYLVTDEGQYKKVEGKSLLALILDEAQYQDIQFLVRGKYALFQTHGRFWMLGIGGEAGSEYHKEWEKTDQREWIYEDKFWYDKIERDAQGFIINDSDELKVILNGRWIAQKPENAQHRGYHLPQTIFPMIPRTIEDAQLHNINPEFSIEYQEKYSPNSVLQSHCYGTFYKAERRPITPAMVTACYNNYMTLLSPGELKELKAIFGNEIRTIMGVDFGSGRTQGKTVISILIHWRKSGRYQIAWIEQRPQEHQLDQARYIAELGQNYNVDYAVGDLGYGAIQVKVIQDGGRDSHDVKFSGLGRRLFVGCRTIGDETKPEMRYKQDTDEHGTELGRLQIDKTTVIQNFIDFIGTYISHPTRTEDEELKRTKLIIPHKLDYQCDFLMDDLCATTRKDIEEAIDQTVEDPRQRARKEFNHPRDSVMSLIYAIIADTNYDSGRYAIFGTRKRKR